MFSSHDLANPVIYSVTELSQNSFMSKKTENRIAEVRKRRGLTQQQLGDLLGVHWVTVSKLERGVMQLTSDWIERLADTLDVDVLDLWGGNVSKYMHVSGGVSHGYILEQFEDGETYSFSSHLNSIGDFTSAWAMVNDDALAPFFLEGDILNFTAIDDSDWPKLVGRLCSMLIGDRSMLATITSVEGKRADIRLLNGRTLKDQEISEVSSLTGFQPAWALKRYIAE